MNKLIVLLIVCFPALTFSKEFNVNITSEKKLYDFLNNNFPEKEWDKKTNESFNDYLSKLNINIDKTLIWKGNINGNNVPTVLLVNYKDINDYGIDFFQFYIFEYVQKEWKIIKKVLKKYESKNGKEYVCYDSYEKGGDINKCLLKYYDYTYDFNAIDINTKILAIGEYFKYEKIYNIEVYSYIEKDYVSMNKLCLNKNSDFNLWFSYNYPDKNIVWNDKAKSDIKKIIDTEEWRFVYRGDMLNSGKPTILFLNYIDTDKRGKKEKALTKLKILEYNSKWEEKLKIENGLIYVDSILHNEYSPSYYDSVGYYEVCFFSHNNKTFGINFKGSNPEEINQSITYDKYEFGFRFTGYDMNNVY